MTSRVDVILLVVGTLHMTSRFSLLAPYPTERLDVILHQKDLAFEKVWFDKPNNMDDIHNTTKA
jgi:hypothetical protein